MRVIRHLARRPERLPGSVLTLGNFDGAHLGHQAIVRRAVARARESAGLAVALTFEPHPVAVLAPGRAPLMLQTLHDRLASLAGLGIDVTVVQRFTRAFAALDPEAFVRDFLLRHLGLAHVVVGYNVNFGRDRAGTSETLRTLGARLGFGVEVVGPVATAGDGEQVSSTRLRALLQAGDMPRARALLGRPYALRGRVVVGDRRGRALGVLGGGEGGAGAGRGAGGGAGAPARAPIGRVVPASGAGGAREGRGGTPAGPSPGLGGPPPATTPGRVEVVVPAAGAGVRLDCFMAGMAGVGTRSQAKRLIDAGRVRVDGAPRKSAHLLGAGARPEIELPAPERLAAEPEALPLSVLYEDADLLAIDKPPGMVVHPAPGARRGTVVNALVHRLGALAGVGRPERPGIVHRLDRDTSGVLLVARTPAALEALARQFRARTIEKVYLAVVRGHLAAASGTID